MNVFSSLWAAFAHLATQARRLGDAFGSMAEQVEQHSLGVEAKPVLGHVEEEPVVNGRSKKLAAR